MANKFSPFQTPISHDLVSYRHREPQPDAHEPTVICRTTRPVQRNQTFEAAAAKSMCFNLPLGRWDEYAQPVVNPRALDRSAWSWTTYEFPDGSSAFISRKPHQPPRAPAYRNTAPIKAPTRPASLAPTITIVNPKETLTAPARGPATQNGLPPGLKSLLDDLVTTRR